MPEGSKQFNGLSKRFSKYLKFFREIDRFGEFVDHQMKELDKSGRFVLCSVIRSTSERYVADRCLCNALEKHLWKS